MAGQAPKDCETEAPTLLTPEAAIARIGAEVAAVDGTEDVTLDAALGRVLAADVISPLALPPLDNSAMDGYALAFDDLAPDAPTTLPMVLRVTAGDPPAPGNRGACARIFTGAPVPVGYDTVVMQENVTVENDAITFPAGVKRGANVRARAEDIAPGDMVLTAGERLSPRHVALAAAVGQAELTVRRRVRVAVYSTGDELAAPSPDPGPGRINDSNRPMLKSLLAGWGAEVVDLGALPDDIEAVTAALTGAAAEADMIVTSGGVSVGEEDHVRAALQRLGNLDFWKLKIKPGKPVAMGRIGGAMFVGLPGNPASALVTAMLVARPVFDALSGAPVRAPTPLAVPVGFSLTRKPGRREYLRGRIETIDGRAVAMKAGGQGSGMLKSLAAADGLIVVPEDLAEVREGDMLGYLAF